MFTNIETERLTLKIIDRGDREFILQEFQNDFINRYLFDAEPLADISEADKLIDYFSAVEPRKQNRWVLVDKATINKLGTCGFHFWDLDKKEAEIGFELMEQYNGQGYMLEAVKAIIDFAVSKMGLKRITAVVYIDNIKCKRLVDKLGFIKESEMDIEFRGQKYLHHVYALQI